MTPHHPHTTRNHKDSHITATADLTPLPDNHELAPQTLSHVNPRSSYLNIAQGIEIRGHRAQQETTEPPDNGGSGGITTPTTHEEEHHPMPYSATQWHSGSDTDHVFGYLRTRATKNKT